MWSSGPGQDATQQVWGGQSYFSIFGKKCVDEAAQVVKNLRAVNTKHDTTASYGTFIDTEGKGLRELLVNGVMYENLDLATKMVSILNISCGICMIF